MKKSNETNVAALLHLSALSQYFIPFGNYIFPIIIWSVKKSESPFVDENGKNVLNFQLTMFLYSLILCLIAIPIFIYTVLKNVSFNEMMHDQNEFVLRNIDFGNFTAILTVGISALVLLAFSKIAEFFLIIYGAVRSSNGEEYRYPLSIRFFK
jgi:uncharacterized protein